MKLRMQDEREHAAVLKAGKTWADLKDSARRSWQDWTTVLGPAFAMLRTEAMRIADKNEPVGSAYNKAMSGLLAAYGLDDIEKGTRGHILHIMEDLDAVNAWREKQPEYETRLNHPTNVWRGFQRSSKKRDERDASRAPTAAEKDRMALAATIEENEQLKSHIAELEAARETVPVASNEQLKQAGTADGAALQAEIGKRDARIRDLEEKLAMAKLALEQATGNIRLPTPDEYVARQRVIDQIRKAERAAAKAAKTAATPVPEGETMQSLAEKLQQALRQLKGERTRNSRIQAGKKLYLTPEEERQIRAALSPDSVAQIVKAIENGESDVIAKFRRRFEQAAQAFGQLEFEKKKRS
jgi:hypothetical protein